jgi:hypothetical protein
MSTHDKIIGPQTFNAPVLEGMDSNEVQSPVPHILQVANQILKPFSVKECPLRIKPVACSLI